MRCVAGKPVEVAETEPIGCLIGRREPRRKTGDVTYAKDIAPILQARCVGCHRAGQIAPFALTEYDDAVAWSDMMLEVIDQGRMPPWHANPKYGEFHNDARMPEAEKELVHKWVAGGAALGRPGRGAAAARVSRGLADSRALYRVSNAGRSRRAGHGYCAVPVLHG